MKRRTNDETDNPAIMLPIWTYCGHSVKIIIPNAEAIEGAVRNVADAFAFYDRIMDDKDLGVYDDQLAELDGAKPTLRLRFYRWYTQNFDYSMSDFREEQMERLRRTFAVNQARVMKGLALAGSAFATRRDEVAVSVSGTTRQDAMTKMMEQMKGMLDAITRIDDNTNRTRGHVEYLVETKDKRHRQAVRDGASGAKASRGMKSSSIPDDVIKEAMSKAVTIGTDGRRTAHNAKIRQLADLHGVKYDTLRSAVRRRINEPRGKYIRR